jgi:hypothetical protein
MAGKAINYLAGLNTRTLLDAAHGHHVLVSFADIKRRPFLWDELRKRIERGDFRGVILDSGAFTELSERKKGREFKVSVEEYGAFAAANAEHFAWITNLDDIEQDVDRSNRNQAYLEGLGLQVVPVFHEGETAEQLARVIEAGRRNGGRIALGAQRPKGSLRPTKVREFLRAILPQIPGDLAVHGFGFVRYAAEGFELASADSTTWIAEACKVFRAGATRTRGAAFQITADSYGKRLRPVRFAVKVALRAGGQAKTVALRVLELLRRIGWQVDELLESAAFLPVGTLGAAYVEVVEYNRIHPKEGK